MKSKWRIIHWLRWRFDQEYQNRLVVAEIYTSVLKEIERGMTLHKPYESAFRDAFRKGQTRE